MGISDLFSREENILSIDFNNPLRMILAGRKGKKIFIKNILEESFPDDAFQMGQLTNPQWITEKFKEILKKLKVKRAKALISIPAQNVIIRFINFPYMPEEEIREALRWELENYVPFPGEDVYFDFQILDTVEREGAKEYRLLLVAAPAETINSYLNIINDLGLVPELIDLSSFSAIRSVIKKKEDVPKEVTLFIYSRYKFVDIIVSKEKRPFFFRTIVTKNWFEDEELDDLSKSYLLEDYLKEVYQSINLFYLQYPEEKIERLILLGDNVLNKDFVEILESMIGISAEIASLSLAEIGLQLKNKNLENIFREEFPKWSVPLGLLLWGED